MNRSEDKDSMMNLRDNKDKEIKDEIRKEKKNVDNTTKMRSQRNENKKSN